MRVSRYAWVGILLALGIPSVWAQDGEEDDPKNAASLKQACVDALAALGDARAADVIEDMAADPEPLVRLAALRLAIRLGTGLSRAGLAARLADRDPEVRLQAIRATPALKGVRPAPLLLARLDLEPSFSREVGEALAEVAGPDDAASLLAT